MLVNKDIMKTLILFPKILNLNLLSYKHQTFDSNKGES